MEAKLILTRYDDNYKYIASSVIKQKYIFDFIDVETQEEVCSEYINNDILSKKKFIFPILKDDNLFAIGCLMNINWEDRNCDIKIGITRNNSITENFDFLIEALNKIIIFATEELRIKRLHGVQAVRDENLKLILNSVLKLEGESKSGKYNYYSYVN